MTQDNPVAPAVHTNIGQARHALSHLYSATQTLEAGFEHEISRVHPSHQSSARNLTHYLAIRQHDIRDLQRTLSHLGLSSLGRMEGHVQASLFSVLRALLALAQDHSTLPTEPPSVSHEQGEELLDHHATELLGEKPSRHNARVMVTMPEKAAEDPQIIHDLLHQGMDVMRINCAHDTPAKWLKMVENLRRAEEATGKRCKISFDLAGPKLRTGPIAPGPEAVRWRPMRDRLGRVLRPAIIHLTESPTIIEGVLQTRLPSGETILPVKGDLLREAQVGDLITLRDARKRKRILRVRHVSDGNCVCDTDQTGYVTTGTRLTLHREGVALARARIGSLPPLDQAIPLAIGDILIVTAADRFGRLALIDQDGLVVHPAQIGCTLAEAFRDVQIGERIFFDDGKLGGVIRDVEADEFRVEITHVAQGKARLRPEKGINLPDTVLDLPALTDKDLADLEFVAQHGDMVSLSFVQRPEDIEQLVSELRRHNAEQLGIVLKIEGKRAFENLPRLMLTAMQSPPVGVMVARGDLGVELGFERLAEVQEEILWLCEAAHVPVIWATQVLESLAKGGIPSRAEVTDAAMGARAECVMLNKGPYIESALKFLRDVLGRMDAHQRKKSATLRQLNVSNIE